MIKYVFKDEPLTFKGAHKANPQKIGEALESVTTANEGRLRPAAVIEAAREKKSVLHHHFEWDDDVAANAYRVDQARTLIRSIRVEESDDEHRPAFLSIHDASGTAYRAIAEVMSSRDLQLAILRQAGRDLDAFDKRYRELTDICDIVRGARERVGERVAEHATA